MKQTTGLKTLARQRWEQQQRTAANQQRIANAAAQAKVIASLGQKG